MAEISPLRRRMIEDMTVRNLSPATQPVVTRNWGELPAGRKWGTTAGIDVDPIDGNIWASSAAARQLPAVVPSTATTRRSIHLQVRSQDRHGAREFR